MVFSVRVLTALTVAALAGMIAEVRAQAVGELRTTLTGNPDLSSTMAAVEIEPRLTIAEDGEETETAPRRKARATTNPYEAHGLPFGGLRLYPALEAASVFSSNIQQSSIDRQAGVGLRLAPSMRLESDWVRHSWQSNVRGSYTAYVKNSSANAGSIDADSRLRLDIRRTTFAELDTGYALTPTRPNDSGLAGGTEGRRLDQTLSAGTSFTHDFGGISTRLRAGVERQIYGAEDLIGGGTRDNSDLNNWKPSASLRLTYSDGPVLQPFIEAGYARRIHDDEENSSGVNADSGDVDLRLGASFDESTFWSGEMALTYLRRDYSDAGLGHLQTFGINGNLTWRPTELTTIVAEAETSLDDASTDGRNYGLRLSFNHALRDNITLRANTSVELEKNSDGHDVTIGGGAGVEYQVAPEFAWTADYDATVLRAANTDRNFTDHRLTLGIILRR